MVAGDSAQVQRLRGFVWSIADVLRGDFKPSECGKIVLPFVVLQAAEGLPDGMDDRMAGGD